MKGIELFDNFEEDGQLSLFRVDYDDWDDDWVEEADGEAGDAEAEGEGAVGVGSAAAEAEGMGGAIGNSAAEAEGMDSATGNFAAGNRSIGFGGKGKSGVSAGFEAAQLQSSKKVPGKASGLSDSPGGDLAGDMVSVAPEIRVKYCACCGKLLFVKEEPTGFRSECNNCGIKYFQKL